MTEQLALPVIPQPDNGCSITKNGDWFVGTNPYGLDDLHLSIHDMDARDKIAQWVAFWSQSRDECGQRLDEPYG